MFVRGIYTPNFYCIIPKMPMVAWNIQRNILGEGCLYSGENVQFAYSYQITFHTTVRFEGRLASFADADPPLNVLDLRTANLRVIRRPHRLASRATMVYLSPRMGN